MILELDCGNTLIKWRIVDQQQAELTAISASSSVSDLLEQVRRTQYPIHWGRLVSVRTEEETLSIVNFIHTQLQIDTAVARPSRELAGVINGYTNVERLGMDRWLALVAAYQLTQKATLIIDLGTAITVDFVTDTGMHLGGFITPGFSMLKDQLLKNTRKVRYSASEQECSLGSLFPGTSTAEAVERGCLLMTRSYVQSQLDQAKVYLGSDFTTLVTGGDARLLPTTIDHFSIVPDLVFRGLALALPKPN